MKVFDNFPASLIAKGQPLLRGTSLELPLYVEQLPDLIYGFLRPASCGTLPGRQPLQRLVKLAPKMSPAAAKNHVGHIVIPGIAVSLQVPLEPLQKVPRVLPLSRFLIIIEHDRRTLTSGSIKPQIRFGFSRPARLLQHLERSFIRMKNALGQKPLFHQIFDGLQPFSQARLSLVSLSSFPNPLLRLQNKSTAACKIGLANPISTLVFGFIQ